MIETVCSHSTGVHVPNVDLKGNCTKPEFMLCTDCRLVLPIKTNSKGDCK